MGLGSKIARTVAGLAKEEKGVSAAAKELRAGFGAGAIAKELEASEAAAKAEKAAAGRARAGSKPGRIGVRQEELNALKEQTIRRSGEEGWRGTTGEMRARLEEGGKFPLRASITPRTGGGGPIAPLSYEMGKPVPITEPVRAQIARTQGERVADVAMSKGNRGSVMGSVRETIAGRATGQEIKLREVVSGIKTPVRGIEAGAARSAAREAVETGTSKGVGAVTQGAAPVVPARPNLSDMEKLRRGIQSGAIRGAIGAAGGYAANEMFDTYAGPRDSGRTPQVQWGRNRQ